MLATHSPAELNVVLVDFKGGATFLGLESAPHVAAVITNLEQELTMVDRMRDALAGEMNRRQELLRAAGNFANVTDYERARTSGARLAPLPALFIVVDEFSELLAQKPDFAELFVAIGRLGRSLHIHLLLASQRLEEGKLRGLDSHLSYRIGLKTFSANESRSILGVPDAYHLPSTPGAAFLKCASSDPVRFHTSYVSGPYQAPIPSGGSDVAGGLAGRLGRMTIFTALPAPLDQSVTAPNPARADDGSSTVDDLAQTPILLDVLIARMAGHGPPAHEVWLAPLEDSPTVDQLIDPGTSTGSVAAAVVHLGDLRMGIGLIDRPYDQRRDVHRVDLSGAAGNVAVVGGPQSGKSTVLRTLILSAAATHTPEQVQFYCVDFGGGSLSAVAGLPHVGSVASRGDLDTMRRTIAELTTLIRDRERLFARLGIESIRDFRARRTQWFATGELADDDPLADDRHGDVFLVLDGIAALGHELEFLEEQVQAIVAQGLSYGVHVIVSASRWAEIRPAIKDLLGGRIELKLGDAMDSELGRRAAASVPQNRPGRGLSPDGLHMLIALPRLDGVSAAESLPAGAAQAVELLTHAYPGRQAAGVRTLSTVIAQEQIDEIVVDSGITLTRNQVAIGIGESALAPVVVDFGAQPHLMAFADVECGKTSLLRTIIRGLARSGTPDEIKIVLVDYRRTMLGVVDGDHLAGYASSAATAAGMMAELAQYFASRIPAESVTPQQLRDRSWWSGPDVYVIVDDYDMVATASGNPLLPLLDLAAQARDIGLHLILTRRSGGLGRAMFDPLIAHLKDLSCDILLMSGDRDEGYITGRTRMADLVPGRGVLVSRTRPQEMIQVGFVEAEM